MTNTDIDGAVGIRRKAHAKQVMLAGASSLLALAFASQASAEEHRAPPPAADQPAPATPAAEPPQDTAAAAETGGAYGQERRCQYVSLPVVAGPVKNKNITDSHIHNPN